jgi:glycosyltransferase involved in cell wall biosynthesis
MDTQTLPRYVRFLPQLRSAYIERFAAGPDAVTYFTSAEYLDDNIVDANRYRRTSHARLLWVVVRGRYDVLALPEPLWIVNLPLTTLLAYLAKVSARIRGRRVQVVTYAIENSSVGILLGLPAMVPRWIRVMAVRLVSLPYLLTLDRIAVGTAGAAQTYKELVAAWPMFTRRMNEFLPLAPACDCADFTKVPHTVLFLGPLESRKGLDTLLDAWPLVVERDPAARLVICGTGPLLDRVEIAASILPSVSHVVTSMRKEMHRLLAQSAVVVSLPRAQRRWREQIGLSLTEGLAHGCHIVTTDETGFATWLAEQGETVLHRPSALSTARAIAAALRRGRDPHYPLPQVSGRAEAEWWMLSGTEPRETQTICDLV